MLLPVATGILLFIQYKCELLQFPMMSALFLAVLWTPRAAAVSSLCVKQSKIETKYLITLNWQYLCSLFPLSFQVGLWRNPRSQACHGKLCFNWLWYKKVRGMFLLPAGVQASTGCSEPVCNWLFLDTTNWSFLSELAAGSAGVILVGNV